MLVALGEMVNVKLPAARGRPAALETPIAGELFTVIWPPFANAL